MSEPTGYGPDYYKSESELRAELAAKDARIVDHTAWAIGSAAANEELRREIRTKDARIAELEDHAILATLAKNNEALRKELAEAKAALTRTQDASLWWDQYNLEVRKHADTKAALEAAKARIGELERQLTASCMGELVVAYNDERARAERAEAECKALREALEPFARQAELVEPLSEHKGVKIHVTVKELRKARAALNPSPDDSSR